jgi:peptidoglycan/xylan/chitin deacetylase (PgdA/CDA1 family)
MKHTHIAAFILTALSSACGLAVSDIRIADYYGDKQAAASFTFDDGIRDQVTMALPAAEKNGFHVTFFVVAGITKDTDEEAAKVPDGDWAGVSWNQWKQIAARGHEIGNHSWSHSKLTGLDSTQLEHEINESYDTIAAKTGIAPFSFCYPYNSRNAAVDAFVFQRHYASRTSQTTYGGGQTAQDLNTILNSAISNKEWLVAMIHGIESGYGKFKSRTAIEGHFDYAKTQEDKVWIAPFGSVARYLKMRDSSSIQVISISDNSVSLKVQSPLPPAYYGQMLTIVIPVSNAVKADAYNEVTDQTYNVVVKPDKILIDVLPDENAVIVEWGEHVAVNKSSSCNYSIHRADNRTNPSLFDIRGRLIASQNYSSGNAIRIILNPRIFILMH